MNDMLFFSPDHFGIKSDDKIGPSAKALGNQYTRRIESISKAGHVLSSAETSCFSVLCSPRLCTKKDDTSSLIPTSRQSLSPSEKKTESAGRGIISENNAMYDGCSLCLLY